MDVRNISEEPPDTENYLKTIFEYQKALVEKYKDIEKMPVLPVSLQTQEGQILIKDFLWRVTEELCEAIEHYNNNNGPCDLFYEEISDAFHFLVEIPILIGYGHEFIYNFVAPNVMPRQKNVLISLIDTRFVQVSNRSIEDSVMNVIYSLGLTGNCLKNKRWKQSEVIIDVNKFNACLGEAFNGFFWMCARLGLSAYSLYKWYFKKMKVNKFRQESKY